MSDVSIYLLIVECNFFFFLKTLSSWTRSLFLWSGPYQIRSSLIWWPLYNTNCEVVTPNTTHILTSSNKLTSIKIVLSVSNKGCLKIFCGYDRVRGSCCLQHYNIFHCCIRSCCVVLDQRKCNRNVVSDLVDVGRILFCLGLFPCVKHVWIRHNIFCSKLLKFCGELVL